MQTTEVIKKTKWSIDPIHSEISFKVKHLIVATVRGVFKEYNSSIYTTGKDFLSIESDIWINPASINTGDEKRDEHLKGPDFFDVENHKEINFIGNTYLQTDVADIFELYGDLTMKGITKRIKLDVRFNGIVKDPWGSYRAVFVISGVISRKEWGLNWNTALEAGGVLVSDDVAVNCEVQLINKES